MATNRSKAIALFNPDASGDSDWVNVEKFDSAGLRWTANGNLRRDIPWGLSEWKWEVQRGSGRKVIALRMAGLDSDESFQQTINPSIRSEFNSVRYCNISLLPVPKPDREIDHRYGNKKHPDYIELYKPENQTVADFQLIHRVLNLQKRQMCVVCVETGIRPPHPTLGYAEGDDQTPKSIPCSGCFLAQPERFRKLKP